MVVQTTVNDQPCEEIFSAGADGKLLRWQLDAEQNCDIYECIVSGGSRHPVCTCKCCSTHKCYSWFVSSVCCRRCSNPADKACLGGVVTET